MTRPVNRTAPGTVPQSPRQRRHRAPRRALLVLGVMAAAAIGVQLSGAPAQDARALAADQLPVTAGGSSLPSSQPAQPPGPRGVPPPQPPVPGQSPLERGRQLYRSGCASCHGQNGGGSQRGPTLVGVGAASADFQLSTGRMPLAEVVDQPRHAAPAYGPSDINALVAYVASLGPGQPIPQLGPGDLQSGLQLYIANCASCHASSGVGAALPAGQVAPSVLSADSRQIAEAVRVGPGLMPQFPRTVLSDEQLAAIVAYVQAIPPRDDRGGWPLGSIGPVTEGAVGWLVGLGLLVVVIRLLGKRADS